MKIRKTLIFLGTSVAFLVGLGLQQATAQASIVHKGLPTAFIGRWKHHTGYSTGVTNSGKKYRFETADYFHGYKSYFVTGGTYLDSYPSKVRYNRYVGHHTYRIWYNESLTEKHKVGYLHWYSKDKIGVKWSGKQNKYFAYNSKAPIYNYHYKW
ncbi:hypothetical protein OQI89_08965 [Lentilactobacillus diolivorans]|uniref:hypothetical protein n=1 Tax=Lentilactobacillus diolivorans TaxID=179838 RepID=UPI0024683D71|nr:hypothetical protein [Lentilactobacillus diolivorans]MDH5105980.1 hypothetical protein [Lentilactobacillus diolivorans]